MTIQCRTETKDVESLTVKSGIHESDLFFIHKAKQESPTIRDIFQGRFQYRGDFPNMDILIKDLFLNDTGPYWCLYQKRNGIKRQMETLKGKGSVLLVVSDVHKECPPPYEDKFLVAITVAAAVLFCILAGFILWLILKTKTFCCSAKPRPVPTNEVYEDMRATLRR